MILKPNGQIKKDILMNTLKIEMVKIIGIFNSWLPLV